MADAPVVSPQEEVRFALVLYGGVSLAVYMSGVATEFWRVVRASRGEEVNPYADVLRDANATATVDVVSGTSAGGINGVLLAKALSTGADLAVMREFWIANADMDALLRSTKDPAPRSLLSADYFERQIADALERMDDRSSGRPLVDVLDLFVSGTRLQGDVREFTDGLGHDVATLQYRKSFHLKYRRSGYNPADAALGYDHCDFEAKDAAMLVEIARATSAFPGAFEPKLIAAEEGNAPLFDPGEPPAAYFSDGGVLHNRPFTEAIAAVTGRMADLPVRRLVVSVDPDPERFPAAAGAPHEPEVAGVLGATTFAIPRYQSIAVDLDAIVEHNERVDRAAALLQHVEASVDVEFRSRVEDSGEEEFRAFLRGQVADRGYTAMKLESVVADLAGRILHAASVPDAERPAVEQAIRRYAGLAGSSAPADDAWVPFLDEFDDGYRLRRVAYLIRALNRVAGALGSKADALGGAYRTLWAQYDRIRQLAWDVFEGSTPTAGRLRDEVRGTVGADLGRSVAGVLPDLAGAYREGLAAIRADTLAACVAADALRASLPEAPWPQATFVRLLERYEARDMLLLPIQSLAGLGEAEPIGFVRVTPSAATYVNKAAKDKLAGDALGHFGGFVSREWRANDVLWGRLDAAEIIVRVLLEQVPGVGREQVEERIRAVQQDIARFELPALAREPSVDYRRYLEDEHDVGSQDLASLPAAQTVPLGLRAATVLRAMLRRLETAPGAGPAVAYRTLGSVLGAVLGAARWPAQALFARATVARGVGALAVLVALAFAVLLVVLGALHVVPLTGTLWVWIAGFAAPALAWLVLAWIASRLRRAAARRRSAPRSGAA